MEHFIDGHWEFPSSGQYLQVTNPCTGEVIDTIARGNEKDVQKALANSEKAFRGWYKQPTSVRAALQHKAATLMREEVELLSHTLSRELGRPLSGCRQEIIRSAELLDYYAEEGLRIKGEMPWNNEAAEKVFVTRHPVGVVVVITPFNYPVNLLVFKLGAALMAGCTVVAKPSEDTPLSTLMMADIFRKAGYPNGVFNVITGLGSEIGDLLVENPITRKVAFTGGTSTGQHIGALAALSTKRVTLELGGHSPAIVCADAEVDKAAEAIVRHGFANSGQFCYRVNRVYAHRAIYVDLVEKMGALAQKLQVGTAMDERIDLGPLVNEKIFDNSVRQVEDARRQGARVVCGGKRLIGGIFDQGYYFPPTIIAEATHDMKIMKEETFGPVIGIMPFDNNEEAVHYANDSIYGLAAYVFSRDISSCLSMADALEAGSVWINNIQRSYHYVPFGGFKQSGIGREKSRYGIESYTELKSVYLSYTPLS